MYLALASLCIYVVAALAKSSQLKPCIDMRIMLLVETSILISSCATVAGRYLWRDRELEKLGLLIIIFLPDCLW